MADRDRNTRFFHQYTIQRRRRNAISTLKIDDDWVMDEVILKDHVWSYFNDVFNVNAFTGL